MDNIKLLDTVVVSRRVEAQYKLEINGKEVLVSHYENYDEFGCESDTEIFKAKEFLTEDEKDEVLDFVNDLIGG